ncbi:MAG TPA: hypothetical protein VHO06_23205 [Polyangia bacterium]|nr:hypothetical protein [Polyangia bacterium]
MRRVTVAGLAARLSLLVSLAACWTPPRIVSARDPEFNGRITRLLVLVVDDGSNDAAPTRVALDAQLKARHVDHRVVESSGQGQMTDPVATGMFVPDATLRVTPNLTIWTEVGGREEVHVDASLYLPGDFSHRIWRAKVIHGTGSANVDVAGTPHWATLFARRVIDQLFLDGVLR